MEASCKSCGTVLNGNYCSNCGQRTIGHRFTVKESIGWLLTNIFNLEKGFIHTTWALIKNPGKVVSDYLSGITIPYAHPFRFIFVWATVSTVIAVYTGAYDEIGKISMELNGQDPASSNFAEEYSKFFKQYMSVMYMAFIPFFAIGTKMLYRKHKLYFAEHLILNSFSQGASIAIGLPVMLCYLLAPHESYMILGVVALVLGVLVVSYINSRFFKENIILSIFKYILNYFLLLFMIMILGIIVVLIHALLIKYAGFENIYETFKNAADAAKAAEIAQ